MTRPLGAKSCLSASPETCWLSVRASGDLHAYPHIGETDLLTTAWCHVASHCLSVRAALRRQRNSLCSVCVSLLILITVLLSTPQRWQPKFKFYNVHKMIQNGFLMCINKTTQYRVIFFATLLIKFLFSTINYLHKFAKNLLRTPTFCWICFNKFNTDLIYIAQVDNSDSGDWSIHFEFYRVFNSNW